MSETQSIFNLQWLDKRVFPEFAYWVSEVKGDLHAATCIKCRKPFQLSNMGKRALVSHMNGTRHKINMKALINQPTFQTCSFRQPLKTVSASSNPSVICDVNVEPSNSTSVIQPTSVSNTAIGIQQGTLDGYITQDDVTKAEVLWCMKIVMGHFSLNSCRDLGSLFKKMFCDSAVAQKFTLGSTKASYFISYGLAPHFKNRLVDEVAKCESFVVCFDEAFNKIAKRSQMDLVVRFWNNELNKVATRYLTSTFMGHTTANDILDHFISGLSMLPLYKLLQTSMDGPNVNHKFLRELRAKLEVSADSPKLLDLGSCGLHVVHGSLQAGHKAANWEVNSLLRGLYNLFKDSPARRADFTSITDSNVFPKKFCQTRWVENVAVTNRALDVFSNVKKYVTAVRKNLPSTISSKSVIQACDDPLTLARLSFFAFVANILEPFLRRFQTAQPMAPFLYDSVEEMLRSLMRRFIKKNVMKDATTCSKLMKIDVKDNDNLLIAQDTDLGFATSRALNNSTQTTQLKKLEFRTQCRNFLSATTQKIMEKSPLKYPLVRAISCLNPSLILIDPALCEVRMKRALQLLYENNRVSAKTAEKADEEFVKFYSLLKDPNIKAKFTNFNMDKEPLDTFYAQLMDNDNRFTELWNVTRMVLILSHGNASVESGFSVNEDLLLENMHEHSVVTQRQVYDAIHNSGGMHTIVIDKKLLLSVRSARSRYQADLESKRCADDREHVKKVQRKRIAEEIAFLEAKKQMIQNTTLEDMKNIEEQLSELRNK